VKVHPLLADDLLNMDDRVPLAADFTLHVQGLPRFNNKENSTEFKPATERKV
jgi:hypothetical protein